MAGLTLLGIFHTAISLIAVVSGAIVLLRDKKITWFNSIGKMYVITTILTCLTSFGIFQHGGFGTAHVLSIITLLLVLLAWITEKYNKPFGRFSPYISILAYSTTFFFHFVAGTTETLTRLPVSSPFASGPDDPHLKIILVIILLLFLVSTAWQVMQLRKKINLY